MTLKPWRTVSESVVSRNPWWTYRRDTFELPTGRTGEYHYVHTNGASMVLPVTEQGLLLLVNQYRYLARRESLEFPCGSVKDGASYEETARQELAEETGYAARELSLIGEFNPYNGVTDEMCRVYIARGLYRTDATPDETEELEICPLAPAEIERRMATGEIWDGMSLAAWILARGHVQ